MNKIILEREENVTIDSFFEKIFNVIFGITIIFILCAVILLGDKHNYCKSALTGVNLLVITCSILFIMCLFLSQKKIKTKPNTTIFIIVNIFILLFQLVVFLGIYFKTGWDVWTIDYCARVLTGEYGYLDGLSVYYSRYPNNILLTLIYALNLKISSFLGIADIYDGLVIHIIMNAILSQLAAYLVYYCLQKKLGNKWALLGWGISILFVVFSPWVLIPYSDPLAIVIPIAIYALYIEAKKKTVSIFLIGFLSLIGYYLKPQAIIITIAIILYETIRIKRDNVTRYISFILIFLVGILGAGIVKEIAYSEFEKKIVINQNETFSLLHWTMMGLNDVTQGRYLESDVLFSASFKSADERRAAQKDIIQERLLERDINQLISFEINKLADCYSDGTFSWSTGTGDFYLETGSNDFISIAKEIFYYDGKYYTYFSTIRQIIWFALILCCFVSLLHKNDLHVNVLRLAIVGVTFFELIFEVFPRHLLCNVPCFIILAVYGMQNMVFRLNTLLKRKIV